MNRENTSAEVSLLNKLKPLLTLFIWPIFTADLGRYYSHYIGCKYQQIFSYFSRPVIHM